MQPASPTVYSQHSGLEDHDAFMHLALGVVSVALGLLDRLRAADAAMSPPAEPQASELPRGLLR
jgi:hypothetical protein